MIKLDSVSPKQKIRLKIGTGGLTMSNIHIGDKVVMNDKYRVSEANKGKVWIVNSEPWNCCGTLVVLLLGKAGGYAVDGLTVVERRSDNG